MYLTGPSVRSSLPSVSSGQPSVATLNASSTATAGESRPDLASPVPPSISAQTVSRSTAVSRTSLFQLGAQPGSGEPNKPRPFAGPVDNVADRLKREAEISRLKARDAEVRAHEMAHLSAAGGHALGGPQYDYKTGPDGKQYAVGGRVRIDVSEVVGDPAATILKARTIRRAALAPSKPSGQDHRVAARAAAMEARAQRELHQKGTAAANRVIENPFSTRQNPSVHAGREEPFIPALTRQTNKERHMILTSLRDDTQHIVPAMLSADLESSNNDEVLAARLRAFSVESIGCLNCGAEHEGRSY